MNGPSTNNAPASEATSNKDPKRSSDKSKDFLAHREAAAKNALFQKISETAGHLVALVDPSSLVRDHPLGMTGLAALGGFLAGSREKPAPEKAAAPSSLLGVLLGAGIEIAKDALVPVMTEKFGEKLKG